MEEAQEQPSCFTPGREAKEMISAEKANAEIQSKVPWLRKYMWWLQVGIYALFLISGQAVGTLLGGVYFDNGGESKWLATLVQVVGFPVLLPFLFISSTKNRGSETYATKPSVSVFASLYGFLGLLVASNCLLYSLGLKYLPVSTYSLVCASQLGFNALFSVFLNAQKLTPFIINSLVLLTISSVILVLQNDSGDTKKTSKNKYAIGFVCTVAASADYALLLSLTQLAFQRIIKRETLRAILDMIIYQSIVSTILILIGLFASGEWKSLNTEMEEFKGGKISYVMNLFWTAIAWQLFSIGCVGLIFKVSSLFSNAISVVGLPVTPVLAVIFLNEKMTATKVVSLLLAIWGFTSYAYQKYLDDLKTKAEGKSSNDVSEVPITEIQNL